MKFPFGAILGEIIWAELSCWRHGTVIALQSSLLVRNKYLIHSGPSKIMTWKIISYYVDDRDQHGVILLVTWLQLMIKASAQKENLRGSSENKLTPEHHGCTNVSTIWSIKTVANDFVSGHQYLRRWLCDCCCRHPAYHNARASLLLDVLWVHKNPP